MLYEVITGREDLLENPKFEDNLKRTEFKEDLLPEIIKVIETKTTAEWTKIFEDAKLPYSPVNTMAEIIQHPQVKARNMVVETSDNLGGTIQVAGNPIKMTNIEETSTRGAAPDVITSYSIHYTKLYDCILNTYNTQSNRVTNS